MAENTSAALVDWGTSSFRLWQVNRSGQVIGRRSSSEGMLATLEKGFAAVLNRHLAALGADDDTPAVVCGMAGAKGAWTEAGYMDLPASLDEIAQKAIRVEGAGRKVFIVPGLAKRDQVAADVIRGEETMLLGASLRAAGDGAENIYCQPGTHSKWISMRASKVCDFRTYMTGELFDTISRHTIIRQSVGSAQTSPSFDVDGAFGEAVRVSCHGPARFTNLLFGIRAGAILFGTGRESASETLSGILVGMELAGELKRSGNGPVSLIASGVLKRCYESAFAALNVNYRTYDAEDLVLAGLGRVARILGMIDAEPAISQKAL